MIPTSDNYFKKLYKNAYLSLQNAQMSRDDNISDACSFAHQSERC